MNHFSMLQAPILSVFDELGAEDLPFGPSPKLEMGDVALPAFMAARKLGMKPPEAAQEILEKAEFGSDVVSCQAMGPYLNFKLNRCGVARYVVSAILDEQDRYGSDHSGTDQKMLIEHTSINPNASPHVGRARNAMFGDTLVRLFHFEDYDVDVHYYVNDIGRQIGLLALYVDDVSSMAFDDVLQAYVEANAKAETDEDFARRGYEMLAKMEEGDPETAKKFHELTSLCLKVQTDVLARLGITYDCFDRESKYLKDPRLDMVVDALKEKDAVFTDEDERLVVDLSKIGHERDEGRYFVLMRANGSSMYGFRDLAYTIDKMELGADVNLQVLGEDHKLYAEQLELILKAAGKDTPETIYYAYILLKDGKMSTRQGKVVLLEEFLDEAASRASAKVEEQCTDLPADERKAIAEKVAIAAVRFAILRVNPNKNVTFDLEESLSFSGDTGPYVQYSCARINSILRKYGEVPEVIGDEFPLDADAEWQLLMKLAAFPDTVKGAVSNRNPAAIAQFALDVAHLFTTFYHDCPVLTADSEALVKARVQLCQATLQTLTNALGILGIDALERM